MFLLALLLLASPVDARDDRGRARPARSHVQAARHAPAAAKRATRHRPARRHPEVRHGVGPIRVHHPGDHRLARPYPWRVVALPGHPLPRLHWYWGWHTHWWVHPWYRWMHATVAVVYFDWACDPWTPAWVPPPRDGWVWVPGHFEDGVWIPGHWAPVRAAAAGYVYQPGFWVGTRYIEGFWRLADRPGWRWVEATIDADGLAVAGHWEPASDARPGWTWEPGFWDGEVWVEGFWRPEAVSGYVWVDATWDEAGVRRCGYWEPVADRPGYAWVPGWFNGRAWVPGSWVPQAELDAAEPESWTPPEAWEIDDDAAPPPLDEESPALALPVE